MIISKETRQDCFPMISLNRVIVSSLNTLMAASGQLLGVSVLLL